MEKLTCGSLDEEEIAAALSNVEPVNELGRQIPVWMSRCCPQCSGLYHGLCRLRDLVELGGRTTVYTAFLSVRKARSADRNDVNGLSEEERVALVVHLLLEEEWLRFDTPRKGLENMEAARRIVAGLANPSAQHVVRIEDFKARRVATRFAELVALVEARYGNALRYNSRIREGLEWLARGLLIVNSQEVTEKVRGEVHSLAASAFVISGQMKPALDAVHTAIESYGNVDRHLEGTAGIQLAEILSHSGRPKSDVLAVFEKSLSMIDGIRAPELEYGCQLGIGFCNLKLGRISVALAVWKRLSTSNETTTELKRQALGWLIELVSGNHVSAATGLQFVIADSVGLGMIQDAAVFMLYQSEALVRGGDMAASVRTIKEAYEIFRSLEAREETRASFDQLLRLCRHATSAEVICGVRRQADLLGGCLPIEGRGETP